MIMLGVRPRAVPSVNRGAEHRILHGPGVRREPNNEERRSVPKSSVHDREMPGWSINESLAKPFGPRRPETLAN